MGSSCSSRRTGPALPGAAGCPAPLDSRSRLQGGSDLSLAMMLLSSNRDQLGRSTGSCTTSLDDSDWRCTGGSIRPPCRIARKRNGADAVGNDDEAVRARRNPLGRRRERRDQFLDLVARLRATGHRAAGQHQAGSEQHEGDDPAPRTAARCRSIAAAKPRPARRSPRARTARARLRRCPTSPSARTATRSRRRRPRPPPPARGLRVGRSSPRTQRRSR